MKNKTKKISVFVLIAIYSIAIYGVNNSKIHSDFKYNQLTSQEKVISNFSNTLLYHTSQSEKLITNFNNLPEPTVKNHFTGLEATLSINEQLFKTKFSQHTISTKGVLINYRKSDIIFPFHYFW